MSDRERIDVQIVGDYDRIGRLVTKHMQADLRKRYRTWRLGRLRITWKKRI
jgi:hypothetical protein